MLSSIEDNKHKASGEGRVGNISTQIIAALRNEQFFSLAALNKAIREKLEKYNTNISAKKLRNLHYSEYGTLK